MDRKGRIVGIIVFGLGIVVLLFVFGVAYGMFFSSPEQAVVPSTVSLASVALLTLVRVALLFVMTLAGSLIASRGIDLYLGCRAAPEERTEAEKTRED